jgi:hypothetical protein
LLVFYFIFVAVGFVLLRERREDRLLKALAVRKGDIDKRRRAGLPKVTEGAASSVGAQAANQAASVAKRN